MTNKLKDLRVNASLTQFELAKRLEMNANTYSLYERGVQMPPLASQRIADYFDVDYIDNSIQARLIQALQSQHSDLEVNREVLKLWSEILS